MQIMIFPVFFSLFTSHCFAFDQEENNDYPRDIQRLARRNFTVFRTLFMSITRNGWA